MALLLFKAVAFNQTIVLRHAPALIKLLFAAISSHSLFLLLCGLYVR